MNWAGLTVAGGLVAIAFALSPWVGLAMLVIGAYVIWG